MPVGVELTSEQSLSAGGEILAVCLQSALAAAWPDPAAGIAET
jgi:hypothetical protein